MLVSGDGIPASSAKKCEKLRKIVVADGEVDISATGDKPSNDLVAFLKCEITCDPSLKPDKTLVTAYEKCHRIAMGAIATGRQHPGCGGELEAMFKAVQARH